MRSKIFSIGLLILALSSGAITLLHFTQKNLSALFGEPALPTGERLFHFQPSSIRGLELQSGAGSSKHYEERQGQWLLDANTTPDRANYQTLEAMLAFASQLTILESFPASKKNKTQLGLTSAQASLKLKNSKGKPLANFSLGKKGAWYQHLPAPDAYSKAENRPTIYIHPQDADYIYLCSSPYLENVLNNGFKTQRDLKPFFFPPELLAEVSITRPNGTLVLARQTPATAWEINKPFQLEADSEAANQLVTGLYALTALQATNKPAPPSEEPSFQISLRFFLQNGTLHETPITLFLTNSNNNPSHYIGRLNDWRKNIEFIIPRNAIDVFFNKTKNQLDTDKDGRLSELEKKSGLITRFDQDRDGNLSADEESNIKKATSQFIGIDELPLSIEKLRGASLSGLDLRQLQRMRIVTPNLPSPLDIHISRSPISDEWQVERTFQGQTSRANEFIFFKVKKVLSEEKAIATITDSVEDLTKYGLKTPQLSLTLELFDKTKETIHFGETTSAKGIPRFFLRRNDSRTIMEIDPSHFHQIAARPYLWRAPSVWNFNIIDLNLLRIDQPGTEPLTLGYSDLAQTWSAHLGNENVSALLNENRANRYLENLANLSVERWLGPNHKLAQRILQNPIFTLTALFKKPDDENSPLETKTLRLAGASKTGRNPFYYGQIEGDPHYFILDLVTVSKLAESLLEDE